MSRLRILVVEDNSEELESCRHSAKTYEEMNDLDIRLVECKTVDQAFKKLDNLYDGAIIDLKLAEEGDEGNQVIDKIEKAFFRIPIAILTGTPGREKDDSIYIGVHRKGEVTYHELFDRFRHIRTTGITRIMGGQGLIEERLTEVFFKSLLPQIDTWITYGKEEEARTEKALLRHTLNHLYQLLEEGGDSFFPEEFYLFPPLKDRITTGSIIKMEDQWYVVMSPACDLVPRNNRGFKTDRILLAEVEDKCHITSNKREKELMRFLSNSHTLYYHWLPDTKFFKGGFINFRKLKTLNAEVLGNKNPDIQISPSFVKDIVARFSSFYARQGQPDIESEKSVKRIVTRSGNTK